MRCSFLLSLLATVTSAIADDFPYFQSESFTAGKYGPYPNRSYVSAPWLTSPRLNVLKSDPRCDDGLYVMMSLRGDKVQLSGQSPMIFDGKGQLVWMNATYGETFGLGVQKYKGQDYLTFWQGDDSVGGHGEGYYYMLDSSYREAYKFTAGHGKLGDLHEFRITDEGTALITLYTLGNSHRPAPGRRKGVFFWDSVFQEINIETNEVLFEWRASDHFQFKDSYYPIGGDGNRRKGYDFFHINSIDKDRDGNYLISSRYLQSIMYIQGSTGNVLWELGGRRNSFKDLSSGAATAFGWQHDARWDANHTGITIFDNGARYKLKPRVKNSRGVHIALDIPNMTAKVENTYINPGKIISASQGSMQVLDNGNVLLGFGYNAAWTEFSPAGEALCDVHIGSQSAFNTGAVQTYKVLKYPWIGRPTTTPDIKVLDDSVYMSWNGATELTKWILQGSKSISEDPTKFSHITDIAKEGFETSTSFDPSEWCYIRALATDANDEVLRISESVSLGCIESTLDPADEWLSESNSRLMLQLFWLIGLWIGIWQFWHSRIPKRVWSVIFQVILDRQ